MALTTRDVITQDFVRETVEEVVEENLIYRRAFREIDASGIESNSYTFYIDQDDMGRPQIVGEGEEAPRHQSTVEEKTVQFDKFMGEVTLTMEAMQDGLIEMKAREVEDVARAMAERLNEEAFNELDSNVQTSLNDGSDIGDGNDTLSFSDIVLGMKALREDSHTPDMLIVDIDGYTDLLTDANFNRATESGDEVVASAEVGRIAGMPVVIDTTQDISPGGHGAYAIDTTKYGYELTRTPMSTREYEEPERQADVIQAFTRKAWTVIFQEAAAEING
jgi:HK97 family phage major capsid protein